jgi:hypothetical protein
MSIVIVEPLTDTAVTYPKFAPSGTGSAGVVAFAVVVGDPEAGAVPAVTPVVAVVVVASSARVVDVVVAGARVVVAADESGPSSPQPTRPTSRNAHVATAVR